MQLSVVMPVLNGERHLRAALDGILGQTIRDFELIVVDDASSDETPDILDTYRRRDSRITVIRNAETLGPYPSANRALALARGDAVARHDADDVSLADRFAIQLAALRSGDDVVLVTGAIEIFDDAHGDTAMLRPPSWQPALQWELLFGNAIGPGAVMFRRVVGGWPVSFGTARRYAEDCALWQRLSGLGRVICPEAVVCRYRRHALSITARRKAEQQACLDVICHEYQYRYAAHSADDSTNLARFWRSDGERPLTLPFAALNERFQTLRSGFLRYVDERFGPPVRARLDDEISEALRVRFGYWLYRSMKWRDHRACRELLASGRGLDAVKVGRAAAGYGARAIGQRLRPDGARPPRRR